MNGDDPLATIISDEARTEVMGVLNEKQRGILLLRLWGFPVREIAARCGVSRSTIKRRFRQIRKKVQQM